MDFKASGRVVFFGLFRFSQSFISTQNPIVKIHGSTNKEGIIGINEFLLSGLLP